MKSPTELPGRPPRITARLTPIPPTSGAAPLPSAAAAAISAMRMGLTGPELEQAAEALAAGTRFGRERDAGRMLIEETRMARGLVMLRYRQRGRG